MLVFFVVILPFTNTLVVRQTDLGAPPGFVCPLADPTEVPTEVPTSVPTEVPTLFPTAVPTGVPTVAPSFAPTPERTCGGCTVPCNT